MEDMIIPRWCREGLTSS